MLIKTDAKPEQVGEPLAEVFRGTRNKYEMFIDVQTRSKFYIKVENGGILCFSAGCVTVATQEHTLGAMVVQADSGATITLVQS